MSVFAGDRVRTTRVFRSCKITWQLHPEYFSLDASVPPKLVVSYFILLETVSRNTINNYRHLSFLCINICYYYIFFHWMVYLTLVHLHHSDSVQMNIKYHYDPVLMSLTMDIRGPPKKMLPHCARKHSGSWHSPWGIAPPFFVSYKRT